MNIKNKKSIKMLVTILFIFSAYSLLWCIRKSQDQSYHGDMSVQFMGGGICFYDIKRYVDRVCDICCAVYDSVKYYFRGIN